MLSVRQGCAGLESFWWPVGPVAPPCRMAWRKAQQDLGVLKASHRQERDKLPKSPRNVYCPHPLQEQRREWDLFITSFGTEWLQQKQVGRPGSVKHPCIVERYCLQHLPLYSSSTPWDSGFPAGQRGLLASDSFPASPGGETSFCETLQC